VASGIQALYSNTTGNQNTANGAYALYLHTTGAFNTASGTLPLFHNTTGRENTAFGDSAGLDLTTGDGNVCIGYDVRGVAGEFNTTGIRNIYSSLASERAVYVTSDNKLGILLSTRRVRTTSSRWIRQAKLYWRSNQSPSAIKRRLSPMALYSLA
jgi:hypothetical protein